MTHIQPLRRLPGGVVLALFLLLVGCGADGPSPQADAPVVAARPPVLNVATPHYALQSTADPATTRDAGAAAEALFAAYVEFFKVSPPAGSAPLRIRLYASRAEFQANNRRLPWAEAYYAEGVCHAYLDLGKPNPHHWLLHEAVHQLNRELTGFAKERWINEGLATYFGSSRYAGGELQTGVPDHQTYPLWWLDQWELSGDWAADLQAQRVIPLQALITGRGGPPLDATVNAHYLGYWSLTHFLLHHDGGKHAAGYRQLLAHGASLEDFERHIGPVAEVERAWYAHLMAQVPAAQAP